MALYTDTVMDHFMHPRNVGEIADADGVGEVGNAKCGDIMKMYLKIKDGKIEDVKFETFGCGRAGPDQQGGRGRAGRSARPQAALLRAGRGGREVRREGLLRQKRHRLRQEQVPRLRGLRELPHGVTRRYAQKESVTTW